jgi:putative oxidoreductase
MSRGMRRGGRQFYFSLRNHLVSVRRVPNNPIYNFFATPGSFAPFFLRLALAAVFFYHGVQKTFGWFGGQGWNSTMALWTSAEGYNLPYVIVAFLLVAELAVCLGLLFGFLTRLAALAVVFIMGAVLIFVHGGTTFEAVEFPLVLLAAGLSLVITGGGHFSLDRAISVNLLPNVG